MLGRETRAWNVARSGARRGSRSSAKVFLSGRQWPSECRFTGTRCRIARLRNPRDKVRAQAGQMRVWNVAAGRARAGSAFGIILRSAERTLCEFRGKIKREFPPLDIRRTQSVRVIRAANLRERHERGRGNTDPSPKRGLALVLLSRQNFESWTSIFVSPPRESREDISNLQFSIDGLLGRFN